MAVNLSMPEVVHPVAGVRIGTACAGINNQAVMTWLFLFSIRNTNSRCVYQSHFAAAPVVVAKENEKSSLSWIVNSGNANAATGYRGETDARKTCQLVAERLSLPNNSVQPFSTG